jgi:hypothetical protein
MNAIVKKSLIALLLIPVGLFLINCFLLFGNHNDLVMRVLIKLLPRVDVNAPVKK